MKQPKFKLGDEVQCLITGKRLTVRVVAKSKDENFYYGANCLLAAGYEEQDLALVHGGIPGVPSDLSGDLLSKKAKTSIGRKVYAYIRNSGEIKEYNHEWGGNQNLVRAPNYDRVIQ